MKLLILPILGILTFSNSIGFCDLDVARTSQVFSIGGSSSYGGAGEVAEGGQQISVYDTLSNGNKRPSTTGQQQGKSSFSSFTDSSAGYSNSYPSPSPSYIPQPPTRPVPPSGGYPDSSRPSITVTQPQPKPEESYAYYYQHYPSSQLSSTSAGGGLFDTDLFGGGGELGGIAGTALGGIGGLGALGLAGLAALAKGALALKPLLIFGLLILVLLPLLILFLPIPIITIPQARSVGVARQLSSTVGSLTQKVLGSEECLERILCKIPPVPKKYQAQARSLWTEFGPKVLQPGRFSRGLDAYFSSTDMEAKQKAFKCDTQFKCSNKFF